VDVDLEVDLDINAAGEVQLPLLPRGLLPATCEAGFANAGCAAGGAGLSTSTKMSQLFGQAKAPCHQCATTLAQHNFVAPHWRHEKGVQTSM
jgi:hypothetical protein